MFSLIKFGFSAKDYKVFNFLRGNWQEQRHLPYDVDGIVFVVDGVLDVPTQTEKGIMNNCGRDTKGDSWYDGIDTVKVKLISEGLLSKADVGKAICTASDCNHNGVIDQLDIDILEQAGVLLADVDQSKSEEELLETSAYTEYLSLIDQTVETETAETVVEDTPTAEEKEPVTLNWFDMIVSFIKMLLNSVYGLLTH